VLLFLLLCVCVRVCVCADQGVVFGENRTNASASYTATYGQMNEEFHTSRLVATLGLSTFVLGIALGPFWSPLAEFYGRRPIYLCSFAGFIIWIIPSAVAKNIETMIIARFFQGLAGSAFLSVSGGTVGDLFTRDTMLAPMAIFALAPFIGPSTGPLVGGLINTYTNWRWTHYVLLIWAGVLLVTIALFVPETYRGCPAFLVMRCGSGVNANDQPFRPGAVEAKGPENQKRNRRRPLARPDREDDKVDPQNGRLLAAAALPDPHL